MTITDRTGVSGDPFYVDSSWIMYAEATEAITQYALVAFTMAADGVLKVALADTDVHDPAVKVGVALEAIASGGTGPVQHHGPCIVQTPATGPSVSELVILTSTAGVADGLAADATAVVGDTHGVFLTDEIGTSNTCWAWIQ